jgi:hypothetical protein
MKKVVVNKRLSLKKETLMSLDKAQMINLKGGGGGNPSAKVEYTLCTYVCAGSGRATCKCQK